jgi:ankyrin repeat protein
LHAAASAGQVDIAELLITKILNINARDNEGKTPLHYDASKRQGKSVVELLFSKGVDINPKEHKGMTPLDIATASNQEQISTILRKNGAEGFLDAVMRRDISFIIDQLTNHPELVNITDWYKNTALHFAVSRR